MQSSFRSLDRQWPHSGSDKQFEMQHGMDLSNSHKSADFAYDLASHHFVALAQVGLLDLTIPRHADPRMNHLNCVSVRIERIGGPDKGVGDCDYAGAGRRIEVTSGVQTLPMAPLGAKATRRNFIAKPGNPFP